MRHGFAVCLICVLVAWPRTGLAQISVTAPSGTNTVEAARDFATTAFQDPWDMSQRTDLGWFIHGVDQPRSGFSSIPTTRPPASNSATP